jgi:nucleoside-diphosphate-sugar epimerase
VRRTGRAPEGIELRQGDAGDPEFARQAAAGADAVYHCMNATYDAVTWMHELPRLMSSLIAAAGAAHARLVVLDNLYALGDPHGEPITEDTPVRPSSRKGEIRARVSEQLFAAHRRGDVRATCGRASDFYGPGATQSYFGDVFWPRALAGRPVQLLSDPTVPHSYHYSDDVALALATLGECDDDDAYGRWWMLPCAEADNTSAMIARFGLRLGFEIATMRLPAFTQALAMPFVPLLREVHEMAYQFERPFVAVDLQYRSRFHHVPTTLDAGAIFTAEWAMRHYGARGAAKHAA